MGPTQKMKGGGVNKTGSGGPGDDGQHHNPQATTPKSSWGGHKRGVEEQGGDGHRTHRRHHNGGWDLLPPPRLTEQNVRPGRCRPSVVEAGHIALDKIPGKGPRHNWRIRAVSWPVTLCKERPQQITPCRVSLTVGGTKRPTELAACPHGWTLTVPGPHLPSPPKNLYRGTRGGCRCRKGRLSPWMTEARRPVLSVAGNTLRPCAPGLGGLDCNGVGGGTFLSPKPCLPPRYPNATHLLLFHFYTRPQ